MVEPIPVAAHRIATHYRLAFSERGYFERLRAQIVFLVGDSLSLRTVGDHGIPEGGLGSPHMFRPLLIRIQLTGPM